MTMITFDNDIEVRDHCHINGKYRSSAHRDCNINLKLNHEIPVLFCNQKYYDSHFIMQKLGKFNLKVNVILNGLEKYVNFTISNGSFRFLSSSLDSLVKNIGKDNLRACSLAVSNLRSETKGSRFESGCYLCTEVSSLQ